MFFKHFEVKLAAGAFKFLRSFAGSLQVNVHDETFCFVCLFYMMDQKEFVNNPFWHGDMQCYLARVYNKLAQVHFQLTFTSFRKCNFKDHVCLGKSFLDGTVFALLHLFDMWERTNWNPISNTQRLANPNRLLGQRQEFNKACRRG